MCCFVQIHCAICYAVSLFFFAFPASFAYLLSTFLPQKNPATGSIGLYFSYLWAFTVVRGTVIKKSPCPEGQRLTMNGRNLIDGRCFANRLSMQWMGAFLSSVADSPRLSLFCEYVFSSMRHMELHGMWLCEGILSMPPILRQGMIAVLCSL